MYPTLDQPETDELVLERVLHALSDPIRLRIVRRLARHPVVPRSSMDFPVAKSTLSHHLRILRQCGLTHTELAGTTRMLSLRDRDLELRFPGLLEVVGAEPAPTAPPARLRRSATAEPAHRVLLLHGMGLSGSAWDTLVRTAPANLELWDADLPWTRNGAQDWVDDPDVGQWVAHALRPPGGSDDGPGYFHAVVAHSYSATAVLELLDRAPSALTSSLRSIVLTAPFYRAAADDFDLSSLEYSLANFPPLFEEGIRVQSSKRISPEVLQAMARRVCELLGPRVWLRFSDTYHRTPQLRLDHVDCPVLLIAGERDVAAAPSDAAALDAVLPKSRLEILDGCGHFPMIEQADRFADLVLDFLGECAA
jgi:pimeloyl-ACP methyl ester carboxylesterase